MASSYSEERVEFIFADLHYSRQQWDPENRDPIHDGTKRPTAIQITAKRTRGKHFGWHNNVRKIKG